MDEAEEAMDNFSDTFSLLFLGHGGLMEGLNTSLAML